MTRLIIYIDSEQKASAYRIEDDNSYSISFNGNEYESDLADFATTVMEELRATPLSKMGSRGGISVLLVSNGATNDTIRKIMELLFHDDNEEGMLNVNIQELNVIEARYFLSLIGNPESPSAKDFAQFFEIAQKSMVNAHELEELKSKLTELQGELENKNSEICELQKFKELVTKKVGEKKFAQQTEKKNDEINNRAGDLNRLCRINFLMDCKEDKNRLIQPNIEDIKNSKKYGLIFHRLKKDQSIIKRNSCIGTYKINISSAPFLSWINLQAVGEIPKKTKSEGKLFYVVENDFEVKEGDVVAVIGDEDWTIKDVVECLKRNSYNIQYVKNYENTVSPNKNENNPLIYDSETH